MRKIHPEHENPIDNICISIADRLLPILSKNSVSPNQVTTFGNVMRLISIGFLSRKNNYGFLTMAIVSLISDCVDGHLARATNTCTKFGDYYDHVSDILYHFILLYFIWRSERFQKLGFIGKISIVCLLLISIVLCLTHIGCQELHHEGTDSPSLKMLEKLCYDKKFIKWSRFFGCGTLTMLIYLVVFFFV